MNILTMILCSMSLFFVGSTLFASTITMTVSSLCGKTCSPPSNDYDAICQVEIWNPPGGYTYINSDRTISGIPENATKISGIGYSTGVQFDWTSVKDGGEVTIDCDEQIEF